MLSVERLPKVFMNFKNDIKIIRAIDHCPIVHPFFIYAFSNDSLSKIHRLALDIHGSKRLAVRFCYVIYWPIHALNLAYIGTIDKETQRSSTGLSRWGLFFQLWWYMCRYNFTVESFFKFRMWISDNRRRAKEYIQHHEIITLLPWLNIDKNVKDVDNKVCFEAICHKHGVPTPHILATCSSDGVRMKVANLPEVDLFAKLDELWCGIGAQAWYFDKQKRAWRRDNLVLEEAELLQNFCDIAEEMPVLVQPRLTNCSPVDTLSNGALCTFRVITFKLPNEKAQHYCSVLRMPTGNAEVDNFAAGGIAAGINDKGRLKSAVGKYDGYRYIDVHPDTGRRIKGENLSCWKKVVDLAINSHDLISDVYSIGWDIAWTDRGAVIIEANMVWCADLAQMAHDEPLGQKFCDLFWSAAQGRIGTG